MKKTILITLSFLLITACSQKTEEKSSETTTAKTPQEIINNFVEEYHLQKKEETEGEYAFEGTVDFQNGEDYLKADAEIQTKYNLKNNEDPKLEMRAELEGKGTIGKETGELELDITAKLAKGDKAYVTLNGIDVKTGDPQVNLVLGLIGGMYTNKLFFLNLPENFAKNLQQTSPIANGAPQLTDEQISAIVRENLFLKHVKTIDEKKMIYIVEVDIPSFKNYTKAFGEATGNPISGENLESFNNIEKTISYTLQLDIGKAPKYQLEGIESVITLLPQPPKNSTGEITVSITNKPNASTGSINIQLQDQEAPIIIDIQYTSTSKDSTTFSWTSEELETEAVEFDLMKALGGFGNGGATNETPLP